MIVQGLRVLNRLAFPRKKTRDQTQEMCGEAGKGDDEPAPWVPVLILYNEVEARLLVSRLNDAGIPARLRQEAVSRAIPLQVGLLGMIELMVPEPVREQAEAIIEDLEESQVVPDETTDTI
jgi:hypothetical protein